MIRLQSLCDNVYWYCTLCVVLVRTKKHVKRKKYTIQDLIRKLLLVDPGRRMNAAQAMEHPWLCTTGPSFAHNNLGKNLEQLRIFNATRKLRAAIRTVSERAMRERQTETGRQREREKEGEDSERLSSSRKNNLYLFSCSAGGIKGACFACDCGRVVFFIFYFASSSNLQCRVLSSRCCVEYLCMCFLASCMYLVRSIISRLFLLTLDSSCDWWNN